MVLDVLQRLLPTDSSGRPQIAYPVGIGAWGTALVVERVFAGIEPALHVAPDIARRYFENLAKQAEEYLSEVEQITSRT